MGVVRVYAGAHYPTDVLGGLLLGSTIALVLARPATALYALINRRLMSSPLRALVTAAPPEI